MGDVLAHAFDCGSPIQERFFRNPLVRAIMKVFGRVTHFRERARLFYFEVILSGHQCPECGGRLAMSGQSESSCSCGIVLDPTIAFQLSPCCEAGLVRKTFHYACSRCNRVVPSRFLFDERVFDKAYFREMMQTSRDRAKRKREELRKLLTGSRSGALSIMGEPSLDSIPGLVQDLDDFIGTQGLSPYDFSSEVKGGFSMQKYREHIFSSLGNGSRVFSNIEALMEDCRLDRIWRFVTLVFMQQDGEVALSQYGNDLLVERVCDEANGEGQGLPGTAQIAP